MSLINDALKRASQAQENRPPAPQPNLPLRPVDPAPPKRPSVAMGLLVPIGFALVALVGLLLVWQMKQADVAARQVAPPAAPAATTPAPIPEPAAPVVESAATADAVPTETAAVVEPAAASPATNSTGAVAETVIPEPAPPKLQAILYHPSRPSAIIDGKSVFVGDRVGELKVLSITRTSATIAEGTQTRVLTLK